MPGKAARVVVTERQQTVLLELSRSRSESKMISQRASLILAAFDRISNEDISVKVGLERKQVGLWRRRWQENWEALMLLECSEPSRLREAVRELLRDAPRSGSPGKFSAEQVCQILALACEKPSLSNLPITHWTEKELTTEVIRRGIVENISSVQVGRYLREAALQPHRRKMWIKTKEQDPAVFDEQVKAVCESYQKAASRAQENGTRTVSVDEMTGVQALERCAPDQDMQPGQVAHQEFEYIRHGTTTLTGNFDVVTGAMCCETIGPTRTEEDFVAHVDQTVGTDPDVPWVIIVDGLNTHWSAGLVEWVAEKCEPGRPLGKKRQTRRTEEPGVTSRVLV